MSLEDFNERILAVKNVLYRFALKFMRDKQDAEDVVQDVLVKVWNQRDRLNELENFDAWCMKLVRNQSLDRIKSVQYKTPVLQINPDIESESKSPYQHAELVDQVQTIHQLIDSLPEKQKEVIHLRDVEGYSYQQISDIIGIDLNQVKVYLFRARNTIRTKLLNAEAYGTR
jgi:RNA polymerase sigma-70 factor (ECF subfamily)